MTAKLTIVLSDEVLDALKRTKHIQIRMASVRPGKAARATGPRIGSLPAKVLAWAEKRKRPFRTADVERRFKLTRAHASMLLSSLARGPHPIARERRGVYARTAGDPRRSARLSRYAMTPSSPRPPAPACLAPQAARPPRERRRRDPLRTPSGSDRRVPLVDQLRPLRALSLLPLPHRWPPVGTIVAQLRLSTRWGWSDGCTSTTEGQGE
jgi:hypothetical protein